MTSRFKQFEGELRFRLETALNNAIEETINFKEEAVVKSLKSLGWVSPEDALEIRNKAVEECLRAMNFKHRELHTRINSSNDDIRNHADRLMDGLELGMRAVREMKG